MPQNGNCPRTDQLYSEEERLICGCQLYYHFVSTEQGANKVLRWTRQLVMRKSGFHFSVWFKFFIIKMSEEGEKGNQDFWHCCFQKKKLTFVLSWRTKSPHLRQKIHSKFTLDPSKPVRYQCSPVPTPHWLGQTRNGWQHPEPKRPGSPHLQLLWAMLHLPKRRQVNAMAFKPRASLMRLQFTKHI